MLLWASIHFHGRGDLDWIFGMLMICLEFFPPDTSLYRFYMNAGYTSFHDILHCILLSGWRQGTLKTQQTQDRLLMATN